MNRRPNKRPVQARKRVANMTMNKASRHRLIHADHYRIIQVTLNAMEEHNYATVYSTQVAEDLASVLREQNKNFTARRVLGELYEGNVEQAFDGIEDLIDLYNTVQHNALDRGYNRKGVTNE